MFLGGGCMDTRIVIFDFDGTLADTRAAIVKAKQETSLMMGLPVASDEAYVSTIGLSSKAGFAKVHPSLSDEQLDACVVGYRKFFEEIIKKDPPVRFPGADEVLAWLTEKGIARTIATARNTRSLHDFLRLWDWDRYFPYVLCQEDTLLLKPNPEPVLKTLKDLSFLPSEALVVGDMPVDIEMGKRAGAKTCGVTYGNSGRAALEAAGADYIIDSITELPGIF